MGGSSKQTVGYKYFIGMHQVLCHGPIDSITRATVDDRLAWSGLNTGGIISLPAGSADLFGGTSREGGVSGDIDIAMGGPTQTANAYLQANMSPDTPGFRGVVSAIFKQCYLGNNPYLKPWRFRASRIHTRQSGGLTQWYDAKSEIGSPAVLPPGSSWRYLVTTAGDTADYSAAGFNDSGWSVANTPFGDRATQTPTPPEGFLAAIPNIISNTSKLWLRNTFTFTGNATGNERVVVYVDDVYDVWLNGTLIGSGTTVGPDFLRFISIPSFLLQQGTNQITMRVSNLGLAMYADLKVELNSSRDMNPIHIIRECLTDPDWGMGYLDADVDDTSFQAAADTLFNEGLGMSLVWDQQIKIGEFIDEVVRHIDAALYVSRSTGKYTIKLIRKDYSQPSLLLLDENNIVKIADPVRVLASELVNTVTATYWNSVTGKDSSVTVSDSAMVQMQGGMISATVAVGGFTNARNATIAAQRELRALSSSRLSCTIYADEVARTLNIGDAFRLSWAKWNIVDVVMRVAMISYGDGKNTQVRIVCTEDVFATNTVQVVSTENSGWVNPGAVPVPATQQRAIEAPYLELVQQQGQGNIDSALLARPEAGYAMAIAGRPGSAINARLGSDDGSGYADVGTLDFCPTGVLAANITKMQTSFTLNNVIGKGDIVIGTHFQIDNELLRIDSIDGSNVVTVGRGCLDTVPEPHLAGAVAYFWDLLSGSDPEEYVLGETINLKVLPISGGGQLALSAATALPVTMQQRAYRPYPPGNFRQNGSNYTITSVSGSVTLTWVHRDRKQQTSGTIVDHTAGSIGPEAGTTYRVRCYIDNVLQLDTEISGLSQVWSPSGGGNALVTVHSKRDGILSLFAPSHTFDVVGDNRGVEEIADDRATEENDIRIMEN